MTPATLPVVVEDRRVDGVHVDGGAVFAGDAELAFPVATVEDRFADLRHHFRPDRIDGVLQPVLADELVGAPAVQDLAVRVRVDDDAGEVGHEHRGLHVIEQVRLQRDQMRARLSPCLSWR